MTSTFTHGFVRTISRSLADCELLHLPRQPFDLGKAASQHSAYVAALEAAGVAVSVLPEEPGLPDSTFVEDTVLVLDELAVLCRLGRASRALEAELMERSVTRIRPVHRITRPGTIEGGDVLRLGKTLFVGRSSRTNAAGIRQLTDLVTPHGYRVIPVEVRGCLHLKTGATSPAEGVVLANPDWIDAAAFGGLELLSVPPEEPWGANTSPVNGTVLVATSAPRTAEMLGRRGLTVKPLDLSELQKAEAGLTCLSVLYRTPDRNRPDSDGR